MKKDLVVIFDFDGTIADTIDSIIDVYNKFARDYGFKQVKNSKDEKFRSANIWQILKSLRGSWFSFIELPFLARKIKFEISKNIGLIKPILGIEEVLVTLSKNYRLGIITSESKKNVEKFLKQNNLEIFDFVIGGSFFGKHKLITNYLITNKLKKSEVIYIGDELRDIEAAKKSGIKVISVGWGFNTYKSLKKANPDFIVEKPDQLIEILKSLY